MSKSNSLSDYEFIRYQKQIAVKEIGLEGQRCLSEASVLIVGCGGLGTSASLYLAGAGVGQLILADGDYLETSNLHRQIAYRESDLENPKSVALANQLGELNKGLRVRTVDDYLEGARLKLEVMMADLVIDCTDNFTSRQAINSACYESATSLVSAAAIGWKGQLVSFDFRNKAAPCYRCYFSLVENTATVNCSSQGVIGPVVGMLGTLQAIEAIKLLTGHGSQSETSLHLLNGLTMQWKTVRITSDPECPICSENQEHRLSKFIKESITKQGGEQNASISE